VVTNAHKTHLVFLEAGNIERVFLHDTVKPVQLLEMVVQLDFILGQLPQRLLLLGCQLRLLVMPRELQHPV